MGRAAALLACALLSGCAAAPPWVASWGTALVDSNPKAASPDAEVTLRQTVRLSLGGNAVRVRISNLYGEVPLVLGAATLDRVPLRFGGAAGVTVAPGEEALSDPVPRQVARGEDLVVSMYAIALPAHRSMHVAAHSTHYVAPGDQTGKAELTDARAVTSWFQLAGVEVQPERHDGVLVAIGDSITDGSGSGRDRNERWTDYLVRRLEREGGLAFGVINAGIGGNRLLADRNGPRVLARFERDVLGRPGVTHALMLIGVNDLGVLRTSGKETPEARQAMVEEIKAGWRQLAALARGRGVCMIAGTLTPYGASRLFKPQAHNEADRLALNDWLRTTDVVDGVADFDAAVRDANAPHLLDKRFDSGDGLHLSPAGFEAMAGAVPVGVLARSCRRR